MSSLNWMALKVGSSDSDTEELKGPLMVVLIGFDGDEQQLALGITCRLYIL